ncbi:hypothetical protein SH668x_002678 [Planctomicrobium sp. SH668]|uniref:hypothetical protein n=1 Tax=Planctomicrobium sp. SH668 TaxID=3448126 RepID=UPI003F5BD862
MRSSIGAPGCVAGGVVKQVSESIKRNLSEDSKGSEMPCLGTHDVALFMPKRNTHKLARDEAGRRVGVWNMNEIVEISRMRMGADLSHDDE